MNRALVPLVLTALALSSSAACGPPPPPKPLPADLKPPEYEAPRGYELGGAKAPVARGTAGPIGPAPPAQKP